PLGVREHLLGQPLALLRIREAPRGPRFSRHARRGAHRFVPPTVISAIFIVGVPMPTGTDCPSLPHVHVPSDSAKSVPSIVTLRSTSGPLPMRFTPLSGAVSLPSSMR